MAAGPGPVVAACRAMPMPPGCFALSLDAMAHAAVARAFALRQLEKHVAVDATLGNGHDAVFLAALARRVLAFDIQPAALQAAAARLAGAGLAERARLVLDGHENLAAYLPCGERVGAAMFNLGFLPGSDRKTITRPHSTLAALEAIMERLVPGGIVSVHIYTGHRGGVEEGQAVLDFAASLPPERFMVARRDWANKNKNKEYLILLENIL